MATLAAVEAPPATVSSEPEEETTLPETQELTEQSDDQMEISEPQEETIQPHKPVGRPAKKAESTHRGPNEDFFDYIQRAITPQDWSNVKMSGLYVYKLQRGGNLPVGPDGKPFRRAITFEDVRDLAIQHGPGSYKLQLTHKLPHLSTGGVVIPFDADSLPKNAGPQAIGQAGQMDFQGVSRVMESSAQMLEHSAKSAIDLQKTIHIENSKQPDVASIVTSVVSAVAALIPKQDNSMIQFLIADAQRRADAAEKDAERREQRAKEDAERLERHAERRAAEMKAESDRQRERDKEFFGILIKQAESKADSLNQMTGLLTSFMKVKETIDDTMGGGPKGPWDLVSSVAERVVDVAPGIMAAWKGAPPAQVAQMVNPQQQQSQAEQPFYKMVVRLAEYFQRDPAIYEGPYLVEMIEKEHGAMFSEIMNQPKDAILQAVATFDPYGKAIMEHPQAAEMLGKVIDAIKTDVDLVFPENPEPDEDEEIPVENPPMIHGKARRINGRAKVVA